MDIIDTCGTVFMKVNTVQCIGGDSARLDIILIDEAEPNLCRD